MDIIIQSATYSSTQGIQKKARPTLPWVKGSRLAVQNSFPNDLVHQPETVGLGTDSSIVDIETRLHSQKFGFGCMSVGTSFLQSSFTAALC